MASQHLIRAIDVPLLLAKHEGCLGATDEGFEDPVAAFPDARTTVVSEAPGVSPEFAETLREFCADIRGSATTIQTRSKPQATS